jgi:hypothetical protein
MHSSQNETPAPSSCASRGATGRSEYSGLRLPFGRPRCEASTTRAPARVRRRIVGSDARTRVSSVIAPSRSGTLRSTRTNTRLSRTPRAISASRPITAMMRSRGPR